MDLGGFSNTVAGVQHTGGTIANVGVHGVKADLHLILSQYGLKKRYGEDFSSDEADRLFHEVSGLIASDRFPPRKPDKPELSLVE